MARELTVEAQAEKNRIQSEKDQLKKDRKEVKRRAKEIAMQEEALGDDGGNGLVTFFATLFIIILWLAVICVIVKLDIGGFGSSVLKPILKDVPVLNLILPGTSVTQPADEPEEYGGYSSIQEAVDYIKQLELEIERIQTASSLKDSDLETLKAEVERLRAFEAAQVEFQRIQEQFYNEVVYSEKGPGAEEYRKWYEEANPTLAESLYRQVVVQLEESSEFKDYVDTFAQMTPKTAAQAMEELTSTDAKLVARILKAMDTESRAAIMNQMSAANVARLAKIMDPDS